MRVCDRVEITFMDWTKQLFDADDWDIDDDKDWRFDLRDKETLWVKGDQWRVVRITDL